MRYVTLICCASAIGLSAQVTSRTMTPDEQIAAAEARGAAFPGANDAEASRRKCTVVRPDQIVFPTTTGDPSAFNLVSGDFSAGSISFGWDRAYQQAKMPLTPRHFGSADEAVKLELIRIDPPANRSARRNASARVSTGHRRRRFEVLCDVASVLDPRQVDNSRHRRYQLGLFCDR